MRCFVAIPLPERVKKKLVDLQQPIKNVRWQKKDQLHITLKFLGDVSGDKIAALQKKLSKIKKAAFSLSLPKIDYFGRRKNPRVLWVGVEKSEPLQALRGKVESVCVSAGFEANNRPFRPHITLARMKGASKKEIDSFINQHQKFEIQDVPVDEFVLYESKLHPQGVEYIRLKSFGLVSTR